MLQGPISQGDLKPLFIPIKVAAMPPAPAAKQPAPMATASKAQYSDDRVFFSALKTLIASQPSPNRWQALQQTLRHISIADQTAAASLNQRLSPSPFPASVPLLSAQGRFSITQISDTLASVLPNYQSTPAIIAHHLRQWTNALQQPLLIQNFMQRLYPALITGNHHSVQATLHSQAASSTIASSPAVTGNNMPAVLDSKLSANL